MSSALFDHNGECEQELCEQYSSHRPFHVMKVKCRDRVWIYPLSVVKVIVCHNLSRQ